MISLAPRHGSANPIECSLRPVIKCRLTALVEQLGEAAQTEDPCDKRARTDDVQVDAVRQSGIADVSCRARPRGVDEGQLRQVNDDGFPNLARRSNSRGTAAKSNSPASATKCATLSICTDSRTSCRTRSTV